MTIEINGMAHVILTVSRFDAARKFYRRLLPEFGMKVVSDSDRFFYCVGARTAIGIEPCDPARAGERFVQERVGLHHLCLRARSREDVDKSATLLGEMGATVVRGPAEDTWAPGLLLRVIRGPGRHQTGGKLCSGCRSARRRGAVSPRPTQYWLSLRSHRATSGLWPPLTTPCRWLKTRSASVCGGGLGLDSGARLQHIQCCDGTNARR